MQERRKEQQWATDAEGYLRQLPASTLLDRLPTAMLGVGESGDIAYANPACAELLGYPDASTVTQLNLPDLLVGHEDFAPTESRNWLRTASSVVEWNHRQEYTIRAMVSPTLLLRETDTLLLVAVVDVTAWLWETDRRPSARRTEDHARSRWTEVHGHTRRTHGYAPTRLTEGRGLLS